MRERAARAANVQSEEVLELIPCCGWIGNRGCSGGAQCRGRGAQVAHVDGIDTGGGARPHCRADDTAIRDRGAESAGIDGGLESGYGLLQTQKGGLEPLDRSLLALLFVNGR